jgi:hypothetical protein
LLLPLFFENRLRFALGISQPVVLHRHFEFTDKVEVDVYVLVTLTCGLITLEY